MMALLKGFYHWFSTLPNFIFFEKNRKYLKDVEKVMGEYDMVKAPSEDYFKLRYMKIIDNVINNNFNKKKGLKILEAGCGQGRIALALAEKGCQVDAVDCVGPALDKAKEYTNRLGPDKNNINWIKGKMPEVLSDSNPSSYDMIICLEVLFMMPSAESKKCFETLAGLVKKDGVFIIAVRSRFYYLAESLMNKNFDRLKCCSQNSDFAELGKGLSWFDPDEVISLFEKNKFKDIKKSGIGILSGIAGDPTASFCLPHLFSEKNKDLLGEIEDQYGPVYPDVGRYIVFWGSKY